MPEYKECRCRAKGRGTSAITVIKRLLGRYRYLRETCGSCRSYSLRVARCFGQCLEQRQARLSVEPDYRACRYWRKRKAAARL